jgi:hypothetical protein
MVGAYIMPILLVSGVITASMIAALLAPSVVLNQLFRNPPSDAVSLTVMRHWGVMVFCFGVLLVYAAYHADIRTPVLVATVIEKVALVAGLLLLPLPLRFGGYVAAASDLAFSALYLLYLAGL